MKAWFDQSPGPPIMRRPSPLDLPQNEQRTSPPARNLRLIETYGVGLECPGELEGESCMTCSLEPDARPVNRYQGELTRSTDVSELGQVFGSPRLDQSRCRRTRGLLLIGVSMQFHSDTGDIREYQDDSALLRPTSGDEEILSTVPQKKDQTCRPELIA